jgi:hypothetical protein
MMNINPFAIALIAYVKIMISLGMEADMGQNEVELPLLHVYRSPGISGYLTQIFILTDGCVRIIIPYSDRLVLY